MKTWIEHDHVIAIAGLAKNTGKTTTLNALMHQFEDVDLGITSIGLDGEALDTITQLPKPDITLKKGTIFATARACLNAASGEAEIIHDTKFPSALGNIVICRVKTPGSFLIAGPTTNKALNAVIETMRPMTEKIFIDGALDRKTFSALQTVDACILSTGASVGDTIEQVAMHTARIVHLLALPKALSKPIDAPMAITYDGEIIHIKKKDPSLLKPYLDYLKKDAVLHVKGAFTERFIDFMIRHHLKGMHLIVDNPTMFILTPQALENFAKLSINASVHRPMHCRLITINPIRPHASAFNKGAFETALKRMVSIPVLNVKDEESAYATSH